MLMQRDMTDDYLYSRANAMQNIESTIVELGGIFQQLAHMIKGLKPTPFFEPKFTRL